MSDDDIYTEEVDDALRDAALRSDPQMLMEDARLYAQQMAEEQPIPTGQGPDPEPLSPEEIRLALDDFATPRTATPSKPARPRELTDSEAVGQGPDPETAKLER